MFSFVSPDLTICTSFLNKHSRSSNKIEVEKIMYNYYSSNEGFSNFSSADTKQSHRQHPSSVSRNEKSYNNIHMFSIIFLLRVIYTRHMWKYAMLGSNLKNLCFPVLVGWTITYVTQTQFSLPQIKDSVKVWNGVHRAKFLTPPLKSL